MKSILQSLTKTIQVSFGLSVILFLGLYFGNGGFNFDILFWSWLFRYIHVVVAIMWIGLLWYFNFVQIPNMAKIPDEQKPAIGKVIAPSALFWFRWSALLTIVSGLILAYLNGYVHQALVLGIGSGGGKNTAIGIGMWLGLIMAFNVWFVIWPNQKRALIDIYPMGSKTPFRIDLFDNEIDSIRTFDPSTQRSIDSIEMINLLPAREFSSDEESISLFKVNYEKVFGNTDGFIYSEIVEGRLPGGIEFYLSLFFNKTDTLFDYLPKNTILAFQKDIKSVTLEQGNEIKERFTLAKRSLERAPLPINKVFISSEDFFTKVNKKQKIQTQSTKSNQKGALNFSANLLPPLRIESQTRNPLKKLINFINYFTGRILIICDSQGRQEVLTDLLSSNQIKVTNSIDWKDWIRRLLLEILSL